MMSVPIFIAGAFIILLGFTDQLPVYYSAAFLAGICIGPINTALGGWIPSTSAMIPGNKTAITPSAEDCAIIVSGSVHPLTLPISLGWTILGIQPPSAVLIGPMPQG